MAPVPTVTVVETADEPGPSRRTPVVKHRGLYPDLAVSSIVQQ